jgi:hypothetical protein
MEVVQIGGKAMTATVSQQYMMSMRDRMFMMAGRMSLSFLPAMLILTCRQAS